MSGESFCEKYNITDASFGISPKSSYDTVVHNSGYRTVEYSPVAEIPYGAFQLRPGEAVRFNDKATWYFKAPVGISEITAYRIPPEVEFERGI